MTRARTFTAGLAVLAVVATGVPAAASDSASRGERPVPDAIAVPAGHRPVAKMHARGVQTYQCTASAWSFLQPDAVLEHRGRPEALHTKGPVWTSVRDGSSVSAAAVANSPVPNAIPQLLLRATANRGPGIFADVTHVQRLNTRGGLAPAGTCTDGSTTSVSYTADYVFWVAD